ncbi:MAG: hypothetical protein IT447_02630 [Phycisphaerales bacterium]|jgi:CRISPR-associated protein Csm4|nr:hypothetical protein [Phycisphaerales bacterium]
MTRLYRLTLRPLTPWRTPWQADTLIGLLLATCARVHGPDQLRSRLIEPMLAGQPPFVLSDAMPGDLLPLPISLRLADWPVEQRKRLKKARWLRRKDFQSACAGKCPPIGALFSDAGVFTDHARQHNTLSRLNDTTDSSTEDDAIGIYQRRETFFHSQTPEMDRRLDLYIRLLDRSAGDLLLELLYELSLTGFGADVSTGRGGFDLPDDPVAVPELDDPPPEADAIVCLSTFQPSPDDPTNGYWDAFPKFGRIGPDFGLEDVRKNTLILFRPGAVFRTDPATSFLGHAVPMEKLLPSDSADFLSTREIHIIHPAFGLTIPARLANFGD